MSGTELAPIEETGATGASLRARVARMLQIKVVRYLIPVVLVAATFALRLWLVPLTGTGAPYVLFFAAVLVTSVVAGAGPGFCAVVLSLPLGAYVFVVRAGYPLEQAGFQSILYAVDGLVVVYLVSLGNQRRRGLEVAYRNLRAADDAIARSVQRTRDLIELAPDGFLLAHGDGRIDDVNRAACETLGYTREELLGKRFDELLSPEERARSVTVTDLLLLPGQVHRAEWILERKDRSALAAEVSASVLPDGRWQAFVRDISQRKRIEQELRESENKFRRLAEAMPQMVWITRPDGLNTYFNQQWVQYTGLTREQSSGHGWITPFHPDDRQLAWDAWQRAVQTDGVYSIECRLRRADGTYGWWLIRGVSVHDESGRVLDWFGTCTDIDDIKKAEEALERSRKETEAANVQLSASEERFRLTIDEAPIGMALVALDGRFARVNRALCEIVGYGADELTQMTFQLITHPDDLDKDVALAARLARGEIPRYQLAKRYVRKDGSAVDVALSASILRSAEGAPLYYIAQIEDVSERKRADDALRRSEAQFRGLIEQVPDGVFINQGGRVVYANMAMAMMLGYAAPADLIGQTIIENFHPDERPAVVERIRELQQSGLPARPMEFRMLCRDGAYLSVETTAIAIQFEGEAGVVVIVRDLTERRRADEAIRISEAKFSGIVSISADAIISIDEGQNVTFFNDGAEKIFGYGKAEIIGRPLATLLPERFGASHRQQVDGFAAGRDVARRMGERGSAIAGRRKNGQEFPADAAISKLDIGGRKILTVALRDITEQQRAQNELRQSQERFELALEGADLASWDWDIKTGEVIVNARWAEMRGFRPDEVRPHVDSWTAGIHPEDRPRVDKALADHFQGRSSEYETEIRVRTTSGEWLWVLDRGKVFARDEAGNPTRMVGTELDITERKRFESEQHFLAEASALLARSLDYEETLATVAQLAVREFADWCIVEVVEENNQIRRLKVAAADPAKAAVAAQLERMTIDRARPYLTRSVFEQRQRILTEHVTAEDLEAFAQGPEHLEALRAVDARSMIGLPLMIHGQLLGTLSFVSSTRRYGQRELRLAEALADRAAVAIDNARFYRAAVEATRVRDQVLGVVAHDLRNPLTAILLQASAFKRKGSEPERRAQKPAESIQRAATRMSRLIQDLLDVTQMEAGKLAFEREPLSGRDLVVEAVEAHKEALGSSSSIELLLDVERDVPAILADHDRLLQVFDNLIGNAIKFTRAGGRVTVGAASRGREVVFWVADTGSGIAAESLPLVFDRFWQATRADRRGAGLGLPICKAIVEAHGGRIWVESTLGAGSTFFFAIPKAPPAESRPQQVMH